eukprot:1144409-Pelagomonas_calceolata.AAC.2
MQTLLRSILAAHPFDLNQVQAHGISVQLTKSEIQGHTSCSLAFLACLAHALMRPPSQSGKEQVQPCIPCMPCTCLNEATLSKGKRTSAVMQQRVEAAACNGASGTLRLILR